MLVRCLVMVIDCIYKYLQLVAQSFNLTLSYYRGLHRRPRPVGVGNHYLHCELNHHESQIFSKYMYIENRLIAIATLIEHSVDHLMSGLLYIYCNRVIMFAIKINNK